jgi:hypothetical protein
MPPGSQVLERLSRPRMEILSLPPMRGAPYLARFLRDVGFHKSRPLNFQGTRELGDPALVESHICQNRADMGHPAFIAGTELDGEGRRRSAGSGAAKYACCDNIRNQLPVDIGDGQGEAGAGYEIRRDSNRGDGAKALTIRARWLAQRRRCVRRRIGHITHDAGMSTMSAAADGQ